MKKYLKLIEFSDKKSVWLLFFVHFIMAGFNVYVSFLLQKGISSAMSGKVSEVFDALCLMLVGVIIYILTYYWSACIQEKVKMTLSMGIGVKIVEDMFGTDSKDKTSGKVLNMINNDAEVLSSSFIAGVLPMLDFSFNVLYGMIYIVCFSVPYGFAFIAISIVFYFLSKYFFKRSSAENGAYLGKDDVHKTFLEEISKGFPVLRNLKVFPWAMNEHGKYFDEKRGSYERYARYASGNQGLMVGGVYVAEIITVALGIVLVSKGMIETGTMIGLWNAGIGSIFYQFLYLPYTLDALARQDASYKRVEQQLNENVPKKAEAVAKACDKIELSHVDFAYENAEKKVIDDYSLLLERGTLYFLVGKNGAGKTTLLKLIAGELLPTSGQIRFVCREESIDCIGSSQISFVPQESTLFRTTLKENLTLGKNNVREEKIKEALSELDMWQRIADLPKGLETKIDDEGMFSGGQIRRISIARALLEDKPFIFLDEPFSDIDAKSQEILLRVLRREKRKRGIVIIAHTFDLIEKEDVVISLGGEKND